MTKSSSNQKQSEKSAAKKVSRPRKPVQVVACGSAFPVSTKPRRPSQPSQPAPKATSSKLLDFHETANEIRHYGSTAFVGQSKRQYEDEQFERLTGRKKKKHQVPLPIVRGIRKKRAEREARELQHAKEAGIVLPKQTKKKAGSSARYDSTSRVHGPAPSIGFMKKGVFRVKGKTK